VTVDTHDDEVGAVIGDTRQDRRSDVSIGGYLALNSDFDSIPAQLGCCVCARLRAMARGNH
jgi:hypothetical protein